MSRRSAKSAPQSNRPDFGVHCALEPGPPYDWSGVEDAAERRAPHERAELGRVRRGMTAEIGLSIASRSRDRFALTAPRTRPLPRHTGS
jgi:hypothetical protein